MADEEAKALLAELARRKEKEKLRYFRPNGKQSDFIGAVGRGDRFIYLFIGGNGVGKTALVVNILGNIIWGTQNPYFDFPLFKDFKFPKRIRIATESKNIEEIGSIDTEIKTWWPQGRYVGSKAGKLYVSQYNTDTGFLIDKMSYEQETKEYESSTLGVAVFDEPPPKDKYSATVARMRQGGIIIFTMTPLMNAAWIQDELVDTHSEDTVSIFADIEDNCREHGREGILQHVHIQKMLDAMDPDELEARAHGRFMHIQSVIFGSSFKRDFHVVDDDLAIPAGAQYGMVLDPARGKPWAMAWFWFDARGQIVFDNEYPLEDWGRCRETRLMTTDFVGVIDRMEQGRPVHLRIIDRHYANARDNYNRTLKMDLDEKFGLEFQDSYNSEKEVDTGILRVKDYLGFDRTKPIDTQNYPRVLFKRRCRNMIRAMERWPRNDRLEPDAGSIYKDHADLVRYAVMADPQVQYDRPFAKRDPGYVMGRK